MRLSGANTFAGNVTVNAGVLRYNHASGLQNSALVTVNDNGVLDMNNISDTVAALVSDAGNSFGIVSTGTAALTLSATTGTNTFLGKVTGAGSLIKNGASTQILAGTNTLNAATVNAGAMLFNGVNSIGAVTVNGGALGGAGSVSGMVTVNNSAQLTPGAGGIGSFGLGALTLNASSVLDYEFGAGGAADRIDVAGMLTIGSSSVNLSDLGGLGVGTYTLINYGSLSGSIADLVISMSPNNFSYKLLDTGSAINLQVTLPGDFNVDGVVNSIDYVVWRNGLGTIYTASDYDVWRSHFGQVAASGSGLFGGAAIPEPANCTLLVCALASLIGRLRQKRSRSTSC
jgi:autotransporter-associated beta strand protein